MLSNLVKIFYHCLARAALISSFFRIPKPLSYFGRCKWLLSQLPCQKKFLFIIIYFLAYIITNFFRVIVLRNTGEIRFKENYLTGNWEDPGFPAPQFFGSFYGYIIKISFGSPFLLYIKTGQICYWAWRIHLQHLLNLSFLYISNSFRELKLRFMLIN